MDDACREMEASSRHEVAQDGAKESTKQNIEPEQGSTTNETPTDHSGSNSSPDSTPPSESKKDREKLNQIFSDFNRVASALDESYRELEERVSSLKHELSETRLARRWDQAEKDRLANRLASLVSAIPSAVLVINRSGLVIDRNPLASDALGEPLIGLDWQQILQREGANEVSLHNELHLSDGRIFSVGRGDLAVSEDYAIFLTDVTEVHKVKNDQARHSRLTAMGEMASAMAHQIRTPLSAAHLYMSPLSRAELPADERIAAVSKVQDRLANIGKLIDSMLRFVRGSKTHQGPITLPAIMDMIRDLVSTSVEEYQAELVVDSTDANIVILADAEALSGALANLVINALEMAQDLQGLSRTRPRVEIHTQMVIGAGSEYVEFRIGDNGPGIQPDKLEKIFDPFFTTRAAGTGLGLAITAMTCKEHSGDIRAENLASGGAEFIVSLPIHRYGPADTNYWQGLPPAQMQLQSNSSALDQSQQVSQREFA